MNNLRKLRELECRGCLSRIDDISGKIGLLDDFRETDEFPKISDMFVKYTELEVKQCDKFTMFLCIPCFEKLTNFHEFRKVCAASHSELQKRKLRNSNEILERQDDAIDVYIKEEEWEEESDEIENFEGFDDNSLENDEVNMKPDIVDQSMVEVNNTASESSPQKRKTSKDRSAQERKTKDDADDDVKSSDSETKSKVPLNCPKCEKYFFKEHFYEGHLRTHLGLKPFQCEPCNKGFCKWRSYMRHQNEKHNSGSGFKQHFICGVNDCGKMFPLKESLRKHILYVHLNQPKPELTKKKGSMVCEQCGKTFDSKSSLTRHSYTHTTEKPFKCHLCSKQYPTGYKLREHIMRHEGIKNFVCPTCGLRKTTMHELRTHMNYHTREKTFPCTMCSLVLPTASRLATHVKVVHYGVKEYHCTICDRSFGKPDTLKHHIRTHTGEKPEVCTICNKRFAQPAALRTHKKTHLNTSKA